LIFIVAKFDVHPDHADEWVETVSAFTTATRNEPGTLWFEWSRSVENPNRFVLLEAFRDGDAGAAHVGSDHFNAAIKALPPMLTAIPEIVNVEVPGTQWAQLTEMS